MRITCFSFDFSLVFHSFFLFADAFSVRAARLTFGITGSDAMYLHSTLHGSTARRPPQNGGFRYTDNMLFVRFFTHFSLIFHSFFLFADVFCMRAARLTFGITGANELT